MLAITLRKGEKKLVCVRWFTILFRIRCLFCSINCRIRCNVTGRQQATQSQLTSYGFCDDGGDDDDDGSDDAHMRRAQRAAGLI